MYAPSLYPNTYDPEQHHRRSIRLAGYDYRQAGGYFVTMCTIDKQCLLGEVVSAEMHLSTLGCVVNDCWLWLAEQYAYVELDAWVVMPNHLHGILFIMDDGGRGASRSAPTDIAPRKPLGQLVGAFKTVSTRKANAIRQTPGRRLWQRNYYEHIIRNEADLNRIRHYIANNPARWEQDTENPMTPH